MARQQWRGRSNGAEQWCSPVNPDNIIYLKLLIKFKVIQCYFLIQADLRTSSGVVNTVSEFSDCSWRSNGAAGGAMARPTERWRPPV